jgi:fluoride exporter
MKTVWMVFIGGGLGAALRYGIICIQPLQGLRFPWPTLLANVLAALLLGWVLQLDLKHTDPGKYILLATGFCGGLSTFSTFSMESIQLFQRGETLLGLLNIVLNILLSFWAVWLLAQQTSASQ